MNILMYCRSVMLFLLILLTSAYAGAQDEPDYSDTTYWDFGLYISPNYDRELISGDASDGVTSAYLYHIEEPRIGYTLGLLVSRDLSKLLTIQTGILYESRGYRTVKLQDTVLDLYDHFLYANDVYRAVRYNVLQIPVVLKIKLSAVRKARLRLGVGLAPEFFLSKTSLSFFSDHTERDVTKAERGVDLQALVNLDFYIPLSKRLSLVVEPNFRYSILGFKDGSNPGISRNYYSAGLSLQLNYKVTDKDFYDYFYLHIYKKPPIPAF